MDLPDGRFTGAASFHMLHHIPTDEAQDAVFAELARVLRPGGVLVAADGVENEGMRLSSTPTTSTTRSTPPPWIAG